MERNRQPRGQQQMISSGRSLKKAAFWRLLVITLVAVLVFYSIGLAINRIGMENVRSDIQVALQSHVEYAADQIDQDLERLRFFMMEMMADKQLLRFAISQPILSDWEKQSYIKTIASLEYMVKRASELVDSIQIMFPQFGKTILTAQAEYEDLDQEAWDQLYPLAERNRVTLASWRDSYWLLMSRMDGTQPLFLIAFSLPRENLSARLADLENGQVSGLVMRDPEGKIAAVSGKDTETPEQGEASSKNVMSSETVWMNSGLTLQGYMQLDSALAPFVLYRRTLWLLTALALGLMGAYLWYYHRHIMRPLNELSASMRQVEQDGRYRMKTEGNPDYNDLYAQFNHMVDHLEQLAGQVYEEQYRAQRAELKQLQMQIDPHFLYNSLYLIYRMAQAEGKKDIAHLAMNLSNYYRYITKMPEQVVRLKDEIGHVMNYLEIQRIRFEPRIRIEAEPLPEEIAEEPIPSLIIQPIVENAFQHGVKDMDSGGLITLGYTVREGSFEVTVTDNSGKMTPERVRELWQRLEDPEEQGSTALRNLYRRLRLYEGEEQVLRLDCVDGGLAATLIFQKRGKLSENAVGRG